MAKQVDSKIILKRLERIDDLPTLPVIAMEVNRLLMDYNTSIEKLAETIEKDQAIVPKLLKLVNSAFYGFQSRVGNLSKAIVLLGFNTISNALTALSVIEAFSSSRGDEKLNMIDFWIHSVSVAVISRSLAEKLRLSSPEDAFTGGLLHDIGKIILSQFFPELFSKAYQSAIQDGLSFYEAEKKTIPITHARIGSFLAKKWQLPDSLIDVIRCHHSIRKNVADYDLLCVVHVADIIDHTFIAKSNKDFNLPVMNNDAARLLKPVLNSLPEWLPELRKKIEEACGFFLK